MKHLLIASLMFISSAAFADTFVNAKIAKVNLDSQTMKLILTVNANPCDQVASPQVIQDEKNPTVYKIQALIRKAGGACITPELAMTDVKHEIVSLPALMEMSSADISKYDSYTFKFEGNDAVLLVPGDRLVNSIQPEYQTE